MLETKFYNRKGAQLLLPTVEEQNKATEKQK
jgi:hypothetical protein